MSNSTKYSDTLILTASDDTVTLLGGDDRVNGLAGIDLAVIDANRSKFSLITLTGVTKITGGWQAGDYSYDTITLTNVESVQFADQTITLTTTQDTVTGN